ncbi:MULTISPECIES: chorismate mutase [Pseudomonas]|uniref:chorismate mutase n=1 Tax=Pseudomonas TaxID=286 RepID=UPI00159678A2|nr:MULTISPECIES: chorismate mutase [Pseudomonas]
MRLLPFAAFTLISLTGCAATKDPVLFPLLDSIVSRLSLAEAVALYKWDTDQPVQASQRETQVLANVGALAADHGLAPQRAQAFFSDQIEANKLVQYTLLSRWHAKGTAPETQRSDLQQAVRPQLDALQAELLKRLAAFDRQPPQDCAATLAQTIAHHSVDDLTRQALIRATGQLCDKT